jgi:Ca2+-binding RTX toxin-like protein
MRADHTDRFADHQNFAESFLARFLQQFSEEFLSRPTKGTAEHDHLNGSARNEVFRAGASGDAVAGMAGNDKLHGEGGDDKLWGGSGNDQLFGGVGNDLLVGGFGSDKMEGGNGNDVLLSRSDAGEMVAAQDGKTQIFANEVKAFKQANDQLIGGRGGDTFRFEGLVNAKAEIVAKHTNKDTGVVDWAGVTGENGAVHDHWVDGFGNDTIRDFNRAEGDKIEIAAHTAEVKSIEHKDLNNDGRLDSLITVISQQGNAGAHDEDLLGTITVFGDLVEKADIAVDAGVTYGAYERVGDLAPGAHFLIEDDGALPGGASNGGHHHM